MQRQRHESHEVQWSVDAEDVFLFEIEDIQQALDGVLRAIMFDLQSHRGSSLDLAQLGFDSMEEVARFFLIDVEVAVARHAEQVRSLDLHSMKQAPHMLLNDMSEKHIVIAVLLFRERDNSRQDPRHLDNRDVCSKVFAALQLDDHVEALVEKLREWVGRIDRQGREHRVDALGEKTGEMLLLA